MNIFGIFGGSKNPFENFETKLSMVVGDIEFNFSWPKNLLEKGKVDPSTSEFKLFASAVYYCMNHLSGTFVLTYPTFKDVDQAPVALDSVAKHRISPFFVSSSHSKGIANLYSYAPRSVQNWVYLSGKEATFKLYDFKAQKYSEVKKSKKELEEAAKKISATLKNEVKKRSEYGNRVAPSSSNSKVRPGAGKAPIVSRGYMGPLPAGLKPIPYDEVKKHRSRNDAWMILNGVIYDITNYAPKHPGGSIIFDAAGKDGTVLFNKYHSWVNAGMLLKGHEVGILDMRTKPSTGNFLSV